MKGFFDLTILEKYRNAGHLVFLTPWPADLKKILSVTNYGSSNKPSIKQALDLRSKNHFRIA